MTLRTPSDQCVFDTRRIPEAGLQLLREAGAEVVIGESDESRLPSRDVVVEGGANASVLLPLLTETIDREFLEQVSHLRGVANYAVGYNNVDVVAATELGIPVSNTPGILTDTTADLTWALILAVALRAMGFEMNILAASSRDGGGRAVPEGIEWVSVEELLERSDFLTIHLPLTQETHHFIDEAKLRRMKDTAFLVNTSRGPVVDESALVQALREGWIAGAGLDVFENEPALAPGLVELENVVVAPHIGSASKDTRSKMAMMAATNALHHLRGERAPNVVHPEVYESAAWQIRVGKSHA